MDIPENQAAIKQAGMKKRSFLCRIIFAMTLTYFLILALLFLAGTIFSGKIIQAISIYFGPEEPSPGIFRWFALCGATLYSASAAGIILFMMNRKAGFYLFLVSVVIIFSLDLAFLNFDWLRYLIHTGFIFILGIAYFSKRCFK